MKWINQFLNFILFFTVTACIGIFGYIYLEKIKNTESEKNISTLATPQSPEDLVNKYMKETQTNLKKQEHESIYKIQSMNIQNEVIKQKNNKEAASSSEIPIEQQIAKSDLTNANQTLTENFDQKFYESQVLRIQDEQAKKDYAKEFIANARKNGYHITLSDDLQVTSVKPIRKPTSQPNDNDTFEAEPSN